MPEDKARKKLTKALDKLKKATASLSASSKALKKVGDLPEQSEKD